MDAGGIVEATERLYRSLFTAAVGFAVGMAAWGILIAPFNAFSDHHLRSVAIGAVLLAAAVAAYWGRAALFALLRRHHKWLLAAALLGVAALWADGGWRSSYYLATYTAVVLAAVAGGLRWSLYCAAISAVGYVAGLAIHGYSWAELERLKDADSVVANTGGYFIAAVALALPISWLGGYVARINQVASGSVARSHAVSRDRTARLSVREVEIVQLTAAGLTNSQIAERLVLSPRTIQTHLRNAMRKAQASNRAELAAVAVREGLVPVMAGVASPEIEVAGTGASQISR